MSIKPIIASSILQNASDGRKKLTHQIEHGTGNCFPCTRTQAIIGFLQDNIHTTLQGFGCCSAEIIPISFTNSRFPCLDFEESSTLQSQFHLIMNPAFNNGKFPPQTYG
jgi:hypothetical protein